VERGFTRFSASVAHWTGSAWAFGAASLLVLGWLLLGPVFHWSNHWQLVAATATTIVTFLMVFVIQATQNRHSAAMQLKLDELISASENASEALIGADLLPQSEIQGHRDDIHERHA
jgi:low affinity Fe/Cu permease